MKSPAPKRKWPAWTLAAMLLPISAAMLYEAQRVFRADWATMATREQLTDWLAGASEPKGPEAWEVAERSLKRGLALSPNDPELHERLGDLHAVAGRRDWAVPALRRRHFQQAAQHYADAVALRPASAGAWAALASSRQAMGDNTARVQEAWQEALKLGPLEGYVQPVLMQVVLADWDHATPAMQAWAKALFDRSDLNTQAQINVLAKGYGLKFSPDPDATRPGTR